MVHINRIVLLVVALVGLWVNVGWAAEQWEYFGKDSYIYQGIHRGNF